MSMIHMSKILTVIMLCWRRWGLQPSPLNVFYKGKGSCFVISQRKLCRVPLTGVWTKSTLFFFFKINILLIYGEYCGKM